MHLLNTSLQVSNCHCIVVGSNSTALSLAGWLVQHDAHVTLFGSQQAEQAHITCIDREVTEDDINDCWLVVASSSDPETNKQLQNLCNKNSRFCYCIDDPQQSSWQVNESQPLQSRVALVGAGPGDPELLTLRALRLIRQADVIVYDRLVSKPIMDCCNPLAEFIYAGKAKADHTMQQETINDLLVRLARRPAKVVRLKGGDPFIFGRGGEEIETLAEQQVPFEVVPGITAANGCAAFAGIPLTHRDYAQSCVFVTGHLRNGEINLNWQGLVVPYQTVVVYMSLSGLEKICQALIQHGRDANTPAALIQQGTQPQQKVYVSTIKDLPTLIAQNEVTAPTLMIIGEVVQLHDKLDWFLAD